MVIQQAAWERLENPDEAWFVAKLEEKPKKLEEAAVYAAVHYNNGGWIFVVSWYLFDAFKVDGSGDRFYKKGSSQWIPCGSIVKGVRSEVRLPWVG